MARDVAVARSECASSAFMASGRLPAQVHFISPTSAKHGIGCHASADGSGPVRSGTQLSLLAIPLA